MVFGDSGINAGGRLVAIACRKAAGGRFSVKDKNIHSIVNVIWEGF